MEGKEASSGRSAPFAAVLYSEPGTLGLVCNIIAAFVVAVGNILYGLESVSELSTVVGGKFIFMIIIEGLTYYRKIIPTLQLFENLQSYNQRRHLFLIVVFCKIKNKSIFMPRIHFDMK